MKPKRERFERVAAKRTQEVLDRMELLSKCSDKNNYEYEHEDVAKMLSAIRKKVEALEAIFSDKRTKDTFTF